MVKSKDPNRLASFVTPPIDLPEYFSEVRRLINTIPPLDKDDKEFRKFSKTFSTAELLSWKNYNNRKQQVVKERGIDPQFTLYKIPEKGGEKINYLKEMRSLKKRFGNKLIIRNPQRYHGQVNVPYVPETAEKPRTGVRNDRLKEHLEFLLTVRVYVPDAHVAFSVVKKSKALQVSHEFLVFGNQLLSQLRDRILCPEDVTPAEGDVSENPFAISTVSCETVYPSSMFFINNVFYIDGRPPGYVDYSEVVKKWAKDKNLTHLNETRRMEKTRFNSIKISLGYPYLFQHQGSCEHLIIFTDARLVTAKDTLIKSAYPLLKSYASLRGKHCILCSKNLAKFIVKNMDFLSMSKSHLCGYCLYQYCYIDGKKVCNFSVYKYVDRVALF